ncbi:GNA1162 family protein [Candidatus Methylacidiphilum infernorum]|uniref:GNA1162 family protein n=1 Tax=Candidatus Methylacidiphilum infernorum TaxID=511746 RepID=UPI000310BAC1|nr:GNA1162 family protein [Candidatus Methylacidiphilum infernorum]
MRHPACLFFILFLGFGCSGIRTSPEDQKLFLKEQAVLHHGKKTLYDHVVDLDPGKIQGTASSLFYELPPRTIAVLPFVDQDKGDYYLNKIPLSQRDPLSREKYRWTRAQRVRKLIYGNLAQREYYPLRLDKIDEVLKQHGIKTSEDLLKISPQVLGSWLNADALIYGVVKNYESYYGGVICGYSIAADVQMLSTKNGEQLFYSSGSRNQLGFDFVLNPTDLLINSATNATYLRDVVLRRAEEDIAREIVLRIPTRRPLPYFPQAEKSLGLSPHVSSKKPPSKENTRTSSPIPSYRQWDDDKENRGFFLSAQQPGQKLPSNLEHPRFSFQLSNKNNQAEKKGEIRKADFALAPIEEPKGKSVGKQKAMPSNLLCAASSQRFFLPEIGEKIHGKKSLYDRLIEMDIQKPDIVVHPDYPREAGGKIAILPFSDQATGGNFLVNRIPLFPKTKSQKENWRWTVSNRLRRTIASYLAQKDFEVLNLGEIDTLLKAHGLTTMQDLLRISPKILGKWLSADLLLYGEVTQYEGFYSVVWAAWRVGARLNLVSARSGTRLLTTSGTRTSNRFIPAITPVDVAIAGITTMTTMMRDYKLRQAEEELSRELVLRFPALKHSPQNSENHDLPSSPMDRVSFLEWSSKKQRAFCFFKNEKVI